MQILLGSKNPSKEQAVVLALQDLKITNHKIISLSVESGVSSKPIGYEIIRGADNRNQELKKYAKENNIPYDYLCSIEGGFSLDENGLPFVVTYCIIEDVLGKKSTGKSLGLRLSKAMFDYVKEGNSLNKAVEELLNINNNKQNLGLTGYLSNGLYSREKTDKDAVVSSFIPFIYSEQREALNKKIIDDNKKPA